MASVAEFIVRNRAELIRQWVDGARQIAFSARLTGDELAGSMPAFVAQLGAPTAEVDGLTDEQQELVERHLSSRLRQGFVLNDILTEFAILGRCVEAVLAAEAAPERPSGAAIARLFVVLQLSTAAATRIFEEHLLEDQQTEKRYTRLLQQLASEDWDLHAPARTTRTRLGEVLELIMEALGAQTAALLLVDAGGERVVMAASAGDADEGLAHDAGSLDARTLAGRFAGSAGAITVVDVASTRLALSDALRHSGIRSLLGVRLAAHEALSGVLYIGTRRQRAFSASELRRIESLGETLSIYLETARLRAAVRAKIAEVAAEGELRERFLSVLMNDLLTPLRAARAAVQALAGAPARPGRAVAAIVRELDRVAGMVAALHDVHQIREGHPRALPVEECDLSAIAREAVHDLPAADRDRIVLQADRSVRGVWNAGQLRRAIDSLARNGLEHGAGGAPVLVAVTRGGQGALLTVHNEGPGIPVDVQAHLFRPFAVPEPSLDGSHRGWGLGLTLVWGCAEGHGGRVEVDSAPGGTTFRMRLPYDARPYAD